MTQIAKNSRAIKTKKNAIVATAEPINRPSLVDDDAELSGAERNALKSYEAEIARCDFSYIKKGAALLAIRDHHLYRGTHPSNWEGYCRDRWHLDESRVHRLCEAATFAMSLRRKDIKPPRNEAICREICRLKSFAQRLDAWKLCLDMDTDAKSPITARLVKDVVDARLHDLLDNERRDGGGNTGEPPDKVIAPVKRKSKAGKLQAGASANDPAEKAEQHNAQDVIPGDAQSKADGCQEGGTDPGASPPVLSDPADEAIDKLNAAVGGPDEAARLAADPKVRAFSEYVRMVGDWDQAIALLQERRHLDEGGTL